jgi:hypothetical protein
MSANLSAVFNSQFLAPAVEGVAMVAAGFTLRSYLSGTTTDHPTYTDPAGLVPNTNPIVLDDDGRCTMYLDPAVLYTFVLKDTLGAVVNTWNNVGAAALTTGTVVSINGQTGIVLLDASGIPYVTSSSATWLTADNVESALDQIADRANAPPGASVTLVDAGNYFTSDNVEGALQELAAKSVGTKLLRITAITATGTWTKGSDVGSVLVELSGGGGGSNASVVGSGGGGGGGSSRMFVAAPGATETVTIGAGGAIGASGGATSFGAWCGASGGGAGGATIGGLGGVGTGGDINLRGHGGGWGAQTSGLYLFGHGGGSAIHGGGARGNVGGGSGSGAAQAGDANTGGGGSGGTSGGAAGGSGVCYVWEYSK